MPRFKLTIEYDGTGLAGWQRQEDRASVQALLEEAVAKLTGAPSLVVGAGRTDAGVHASAQAAHVDIHKDMAAYNVMQGLNYHLEPLTSQVVVYKAERVSGDFHARFSATSRSYVYRILNRRARLALEAQRAWHIPEPLDAEAMHAAAQLLTGRHDFTSFRSRMCQSKSAVKDLDRLDVTRSGEEIRLYAHARSFLHHQVRNIAGTLRLIGNGKWTEAELLAALAAKDRAQAGPTAPPQGLTLVAVGY